MVAVSEAELRQWGEILLNPKESLGERFKALYGLRHANETLSIELIANAFVDSSALLKHELAYCLGQKGNLLAIPFLINVLRDEKQESIVRHEAAEAIGALGDDNSLDILREFEKSEIQEISETCTLAIERIQWLKNQKNGKNEEEILTTESLSSVDPAPSFTDHDVSQLREILLNQKESLFRRYRAMFTLRNKIANLPANDDNAKEAVLALSAGLHCPSSALFRHEVAFVLGQVCHIASVPALTERLSDISESPMVRHECAEALGDIGDETCQNVLKEYLTDKDRIVRESCILALDIADYQNDPSQFQYAKVPTV